MRDLRSVDPSRVGPYGVLGGGGMSQAYLASAGQRLVAVEVVDPGLAQDEQVRARFLQEVANGHRIGPL